MTKVDFVSLREVGAPSEPPNLENDHGGHTPFPPSEYQSRWSHLQAELTKERLDAGIFTSQRNFEYLAGYRTPGWLIKSRPLIIVVPAKGDPFAVGSTAHAAEMDMLGVVPLVLSYNGFEPEATDALLQGLNQLHLQHSTLGVEAGHEQRLGIPLDEFNRMRAALPKAQIRDGGAAIWRTRMRKSAAEIKYLREAGRITGAAYAQVLPLIRPGWTPSRVYSEIGRVLMELGAEGPAYITMTGGPDRYDLHNSWPSGRPLDTGELLWIDVGTTVAAYFSDYSRCAFLGTPSTIHRTTYAIVLELLDRSLQSVHAGAAASEVMAAADSAATKAGLKITVSTRIGHGIGLDMTEPPSLTSNSNFILEPGMALAVEPGVLTPHGFYHLEENIVVRERGYDFLSEPMPRELPVAGG